MEVRHTIGLLASRSSLAYIILTCHRKSQIAIEYCYRYKDANPSHGVYWAHAGTIAKFDQAYKDIARNLRLPGWDDPQVNTLQLVTDWLNNESHGNWLLVIDNADDKEVVFGPKSDSFEQQAERTVRLFEYLPKNRKGSIIVTTRDRRIGKLMCDNRPAISIPVLDSQKSEAMLQSKVPESRWCADDAQALLAELDHLPLAITQAAAFISNNNISVKDYLDMLLERRLGEVDLLSEDLTDPRRDLDAPSSVVQTWKVSFDQIKRQEPKAAETLSLMAVLDRQRIPKAVLFEEDESTIELTSALGTLQSFSLITAEVGGGRYEMHRLVQLSIRKWLDFQGDIGAWQEKALINLSRRFPEGDYETWAACETLSPHAQTVLRYRVAPESNLLARAFLLRKMAQYERERGHNGAAFSYGDESYTINKEQLGTTHVDTLSSAATLAMMLIDLGKYQTAEKMHREILEQRKSALGLEHEDTLRSMDALGDVLYRQGNEEAAKQLYQQALAWKERSLGPRHLETLYSKYKLALVLHEQGNYNAAEQFHRQALQGQQEALGLQHPRTRATLTGLARVLERQGAYEAAEQLHRQVLEVEERTLGPHHPDTLRTLNSLAMALNGLEEYDAAVQMHGKVLKIREEILGPHHPDTLASLHNLAIVLCNQGKYDAAEQMLRQVLEAEEKTLGPHSSDTQLSVYNLAIVLRHQERYEEAETMLRQALKVAEETQGLLSMKALDFVSELAEICNQRKDLNQAIDLMHRAHDGYRESFGEDHPDTRLSAERLSYFRRKLERQTKRDSSAAVESNLVEEDVDLNLPCESVTL